MVEKLHIKSIISLLIVTVCLLTLSGIVSSKWSTQLFGEKVLFTKSTKIANSEVANLPKDEIQVLLVNAIDHWKTQSSITMFYKEEKIDFSVSSMQFLINETINATKELDQSPLIIDLSMSTIKEQVEQLTSSSIDYERLSQEISAPASYLIPMTKKILLEDYLLTAEESIVLNEVTVNLTSEADAALLNKTIELKLGNFTFLEWLQTNSIYFSNDITATEVSSAMYETILPTNFEITSRYTSTEQNPTIRLGFESYIDSDKGIDLTWYNPNHQNMSLKLETIGNQLIVQLIGEPLLYTYQLEMQNEQTYDYKVLNQFSMNLSENQKLIKSSGKKGISIEVVKQKIHPITKEVSESTTIVTSYAPQPEIWLNGPINLNPEIEELPQQPENENQESNDLEETVPSTDEEDTEV